MKDCKTCRRSMRECARVAVHPPETYRLNFATVEDAKYTALDLAVLFRDGDCDWHEKKGGSK